MVRCVTFGVEVLRAQGRPDGREGLGPGVRPVLEALTRRYAVGLIGDLGATEGADPRSGCFHFRLAPDEIGFGPTDPRIVRMAAAAAGCHPGEVLHVSGTGAQLRAAQRAGALAAWFDRGGTAPPAGTAPDTTLDDLDRLPAALAAMEADEARRRGAVGVGPHPRPWPDDDRLDPDLLASGDRRNVVDRYRYWRVEAIVADLDRRRHPFHVAVENWRHDLNIGTVVRNANAFGAAGVHIVGRRRWNRRGAMATDHYLPVHHHETVADLLARAHSEDLEVVGIDNGPGSEPLESAAWPRRALLLLGQEGPGLSDDARTAAGRVLSITQYGSTRSINAGVASGIAMHAWLAQHATSGVGDVV